MFDSLFWVAFYAGRRSIQDFCKIHFGVDQLYAECYNMEFKFGGSTGFMFVMRKCIADGRNSMIEMRLSTRDTH